MLMCYVQGSCTNTLFIGDKCIIIQANMEQAVETDGRAGKLKTGGMHCIGQAAQTVIRRKSVAYHMFPTNGS